MRYQMIGPEPEDVLRILGGTYEVTAAFRVGYSGGGEVRVLLGPDAEITLTERDGTVVAEVEDFTTCSRCGADVEYDVEGIGSCRRCVDHIAFDLLTERDAVAARRVS